MLGSIISAGANLLGGLLGKSSADKAAERNEKLQREFAQSGIQWKVEDAKKAGIHPLYALGAQTTSYAPTAVGDTFLPTAMANAGQDIGRAIDATRTAGQRVDAYSKTVQDLTLTRMGLENELLASQIRKVNQAGHPPAMPGSPQVIAGQGDLTSVKIGGMQVDPNPGFSDAQDVQNRYGEAVGDWLYAPVVTAADMFQNLKVSPTLQRQLERKATRERWRRRVQGAWDWYWR